MERWELIETLIRNRLKKEIGAIKGVHPEFAIKTLEEKGFYND